MRAVYVLILALALDLGAQVFFIPATPQTSRTPLVPNDPLFLYGDGTNIVGFTDATNLLRNEYQWAFYNTGQPSVLWTNGGGTNATIETGSASMEIAAAWNIQAHASNILIADLESAGPNTNHEEFAGIRWWLNTNNAGRIGVRIQSQQIITNELSQSKLSHPTTQLGLLAARGNNGKGVSGVLRDGAYVMPVELDQFNPDLERGMLFAISNGARIISFPAGVTTMRTDWTNALWTAQLSNVLVVCAFAESANNLDATGANNFVSVDIPSAWQYWSWTNAGISMKWTNIGVSIFPQTGPLLSNIISVSVMGRDGTRYANTASWSTNFCNVFAAGRNVVTTGTNSSSTYVFKSGSSAACAYVVGLAALLMEQNPTWTCYQVRERILRTVTTTAEMQTNCTSGGYVNFFRALNWRETTCIETAPDVDGPWTVYEGPRVVAATEPKRFFRIYE